MSQNSPNAAASSSASSSTNTYNAAGSHQRGATFNNIGNNATGNVNITSNTTIINDPNNKQISDWLLKQTQLTHASQQACANHGFDTKEKFALLFDCDLEKLNLDFPDKLELQSIIRHYHYGSARLAENVQKRVEALQQGFRHQFEIEMVGGRTIKLEDCFTRLRVRTDVNQKKNSNNTTETPSSPTSSPSSPPASPTYKEDVNEGKIVDGEQLPFIATSGSNIIVCEGAGGTGKTYLTQMLCIQQQIPHCHLIFLSLRDLKAESNNIKIESVSDLLEFAAKYHLDEQQRKQIVDGEFPIVWVCDGFDEVQWSDFNSNMGKFLHNFIDPTQRAKNVQRDECQNFVRSCDFVIVTSREERTANKNVNLDSGKVDHFIIERWNDAEVKDYCRTWFKLMCEDDSFDVDKAAIDVVNALRAEYMQHFAGLPLFVNMLCELRLDSSSSLASLSPSKLFEDLIELFWKRSKERIESCLLKIAADYKLSKNTEVDDELLAKLVKEAALAGFKQLVQPVIEDITAITFDLNSLPNKKPPLFAVLLETAGLLRFVSKNKARFPHRSYIEFLCAKFASENPATALIVPPVVDETLPKEKQEKVPETILWTQKFATVWLILADFARRNEGEFQQEKKRTSFFSSVNYSEIHIETFVKHLAQVHFNKNKENVQKSDTTKGSEIACTLSLLRLTMILPSSWNQLLDAIKGEHGFLGIHFKTPHHFLWLAELSGKVGSIQALEWFEKNYEKDVTPDLLKLALGHALDRQELPAVANFVGALTKPPRNIPVSLEHAVKTGSVVGTTIAATSKKENNFDAEKWSHYLKLLFERQQYDVAAVLLMYGDWKNDENKNLLQCLPFSLPKSVSKENLSSTVIFALVVSRLPSTVRIWNSEKQMFGKLTRSSVAEKCDVKHLESEADQLLFFFVSVASMLNVSVIHEMICDVKKVAAEMNLQNSSLLEDPLLAALTVVASRNSFDVEPWTGYLKAVFDRQQYDVAAVLLMNGDWKTENNENSRHLLLPFIHFVLEPEKFPLPTNFTYDLQGLKSALVMKLPSSVRSWNTPTNNFEQKSRDVVASSLGLNDIRSCRVSCAEFLEEAAAAVYKAEADDFSLRQQKIIKQCTEGVARVKVPHSVEWMQQVLSRTREFDAYLKRPRETKSIPSAVFKNLCNYLAKTFGEHQGEVARDGFIWMSDIIEAADTAEVWTSCLGSIVDSESARDTNQKIFGTEKMKQCLIFISKFSTTDSAVKNFCDSVRFFLRWNEPNKRLFACSEVVDCFVSLSLSQFVTSESAADSFFDALQWFNNKKIFATEAVCQSMIQVARLFETYNNNLFSFLKDVLSQAPSSRKIFAVEAVRDIVLKLHRSINEYWDFSYYCACIRPLSENSNFAVAQTPEAFVNLSKQSFLGEKHDMWYRSHAVFLETFASLLENARTDEMRTILLTSQIRAVIKKYSDLFMNKAVVAGSESDISHTKRNIETSKSSLVKIQKYL